MTERPRTSDITLGTGVNRYLVSGDTQIGVEDCLESWGGSETPVVERSLRKFFTPAEKRKRTI